MDPPEIMVWSAPVNGKINALYDIQWLIIFYIIWSLIIIKNNNSII